VKLAGKVVVVTGASAGVGRATVRELARQGAHLGLIARGFERLEETRKEVLLLGGRAVVLPADVAHAAQVEQAADLVESELGPIDLWVNNAMVSVFSPVVDLTAEEIRRVTEVTYLGAVHGTLAALRRMKPRDRGMILQVSSALAYRSIPLQAAYCAAKHALVGFTDSLRCELIHDKSGVRLTTVNLPALNTPQFEWVKTRLANRPRPLPPIFEPEVAAEAIVHAAATNRREVNVGWSTARAIAGQKIAPRLLDRLLARVGYRQETDEPEDVERPHNLWSPVPGPYEVHGRFAEAARAHSPFTWLNLHRGTAALAGVALAAGLVAAIRARG
jgi:short-subunit dehydrogenase